MLSMEIEFVVFVLEAGLEITDNETSSSFEPPTFERTVASVLCGDEEKKEVRVGEVKSRCPSYKDTN